VSSKSHATTTHPPTQAHTSKSHLPAAASCATTVNAAAPAGPNDRKTLLVDLPTPPLRLSTPYQWKWNNSPACHLRVYVQHPPPSQATPTVAFDRTLQGRGGAGGSTPQEAALLLLLGCVGRVEGGRDGGLREKETEEQKEAFMMVIRRKMVEKGKKTRRLSRVCRRLLTQTSIPARLTLAGAGFLSPFHIGVVQALQEKGIITFHTKVRALQTLLSSSLTLTHSNHHTHTVMQLAGASGGALVAGSTVCGISPADQMVAYKEMAGACRAAGFLGKVRGVLHKSLEARLPKDAHELANRR
jgi:hypothetical protein